MIKNAGGSVVVYLNLFLSLAAAICLLLRLKKRRRVWQAILLLFCASLPLIPYKNLTPAEYFVSVVGNLSVTTLFLLAGILYSQFFKQNPFSAMKNLLLFALVGAAGIVLYLSSFNFIPIDFYRLGFGSLSFSIALLALTLFFIFTKRYASAIIIIAGVLAYDLHLFDSNNLWNYLIDPFVTIYALAVLTRRAIRKIFAAKGEKPANS